MRGLRQTLIKKSTWVGAENLPHAFEKDLKAFSRRDFHTNSIEESPEHREVHHGHDDCFEGKKIQPKHKEHGDGGKPRREQCIKLGYPVIGKLALPRTWACDHSVGL